MPVEIEAKLSVPGFDDVRAILKSIHATSAGSCHETNIFFDSEDRSLLAADKGLRLRKRVSDDDGEVKFIITFKGPRKHGALKSREELELEVATDRDAIALLGAIGYARVFSFEKRRESWTIDGCNVELDELPALGNFVEIEGPNEAAIMKVRETLKLSNRPLVKASYVALLMTSLQEHGDTSRNVTFPARR